MNLPRFWISTGLGFGLVLATAAALVYPNRLLPAVHATPPTAEAPNATAGLSALPAELMPAVTRTLAAQNPHLWRARTTPKHDVILNNPTQELSASFNHQGMQMQFGSGRHGRLEMQLVALRSANVSYAITTGTPTTKGPSVEISHGHGLTEWYVNSPLGVEQGFTLAEPLTAGDSLALVFRLKGNLTPRLNGDTLEFRDARGQSLLRYGNLLAYDARHHALPARMLLTGSNLELTIDARDAHYPLTIDPLFAVVASVTDPAAAANDHFGTVALSSDGNTALVGAYGTTVSSNATAGAAYIFTRTNGVWSASPVFSVTDPAAAANDYFGLSGALSSDGTTALIGAAGTTVLGISKAGEVYVYTRNGNSWSLTQEFTDPVDTANDIFGSSVALSGDGNTALISAPGTAYVYVRTNGHWSSNPISALTAFSPSAGDFFGVSVALSIDDSTALIGAPQTTVNGINLAGEAYLFLQNGGTWPNTPGFFTDPNPKMGDNFGESVAVSGDGTSILIGAPGFSVGGAGSADLYAQTGNVWPGSPTASFTEPAATALDYFGSSVALSSNGAIALIGSINTAVNGKPQAGVTYVYTQTSGSWLPTPAPVASLTDPAIAARDNFGNSVAVSGDGQSALVGAPGTSVSGNINAGEVYFLAASADLSLALSSNPASVNVNGSVTYMLTVTNSDTQVTATSLSLTDTLPAGMTYVSANAAGGACNSSNGTVTCTLASLAPQATWQPSITVTATMAGSIQDTATVSASQSDPNKANNTANVTISVSAPPSSGGGGGGGGGALGFLSALLLAPLVRLRKRKV